MSQQYTPPSGQPGPTSPGQPKQFKKTSTAQKVLIILGVLVGVPVLAVVANRVEEGANSVHTVTYEVTGIGSSAASMTYDTDDTGSGEQVTDAPLPWSKSVSIGARATLYQVLAQNSGSGSITCSIAVDGTVVKTATASGQGAIAHCSYSP